MTNASGYGVPGRRAGAAALLAWVVLPVWAGDPSFDCRRVDAGSTEAAICASDSLSALDRQLALVYREAREAAGEEGAAALVAGQRGWIAGRDDCWKADDADACVADSYRLRIAELQAGYALVAARGPVIYRCAGGEVVATYYATEPPSLVAERGGERSLMLLQPSGSGARYQGRNESLWEHQGEAGVSWGPGAARERCPLQP